MPATRRALWIVALMLLASSAASAQEKETVHWTVVQRLREEVFANEELMENASWLTDVFGPRNAKSPSYRAAAEWSVGKLAEYGLSNPRLEPYEFGVGYVNEYVSVHMMAPQYMPLLAYPATWSPGTDGKVRGQAVHINFDEITSMADLEPYRGRLQNAIVFTVPKQEVSTTFPKPAAALQRQSARRDVARQGRSAPAGNAAARSRVPTDCPDSRSSTSSSRRAAWRSCVPTVAVTTAVWWSRTGATRSRQSPGSQTPGRIPPS